MAGYQKQLEMLTELSTVLNGIIQDLEEELKHIELSQKRQLTESNGSNNINIQEIKEAFKEYRKYVIAKANSEIEKALTSHAGSCSDQMDKKIRDEESGIWKKFRAGFIKDMTFEQRLQLLRCRRS